LLDLRFFAELGRREALTADVVLHVVAAAIGRRRQEADLGDDDLRAIAALAGLPVELSHPFAKSAKGHPQGR